ncbi:neurocalcin-delta isoform X1 [Prionailurus iriomotensis]
MREYPSGLQTLHEFKTLLGLQGLNQKANQHVDQVYNTFDMNKSAKNKDGVDGFIDFLEFIAAINLVVRGKMEQKLKWYFKLYDADGNGSIDKKELLNIFMPFAVQALNGQQTLSPEEFTNLVFHKIDKNNDGELTLEEFINGTEEDQDLLEIVSKSFDFSSVLKIIYNGNQPDTEGRFPSNLVTRLI